MLEINQKYSSIDSLCSLVFYHFCFFKAIVVVILMKLSAIFTMLKAEIVCFDVTHANPIMSNDVQPRVVRQVYVS